MLAPSPSLEQWLSFGPVSLWDIMMRIRADQYIEIGRQIEFARDSLLTANRDESFQVYEALSSLAQECKKLGLVATHDLLNERIKEDGETYLPQTIEEFDFLIEVTLKHLKDVRFLHIRPGYYQRNLLSADARDAFPKLTQELRSAGNSFACGLDTACVFHCMRALEHSLDAMAVDCGLTWTKEQWHNIIEMIEAAVEKERKTLPKGTPKDERLNTLSQAAKEFFYFKDGWRNYVSHNRVSYQEAQALDALQHVCAFVEHLVSKLQLKERA